MEERDHIGCNEEYLLEAGWGMGEKMIGITQPRRVAATSLASRVADEMGAVLGDEVGYAIRFDEKFNPKTTKVKYLTEGLLIREMMSDPLLRQYSVIMLDEVHERTVNSDILMGLLRKILKARKDLKLIVSSATVDAEELKLFFELKSKKSKDRKTKETSVILSVSGRTYPIEICFSIDPVPDYVKESVNTVVKIHEREDRGDILVFLTGQDEVDTAVSLLMQHSTTMKERGGLEMTVLPMYGSLPARDQLKVFQYPPKGHRKVVVCTNIAETSITISGIVYVVDCGFVKMRWFNPESFTDSLVVVPTSKASAEQRAGRAGRTKPGKVYRLYPEHEYEKLPTATCPEIQRNDLAQTVLQLKALGIDNIVRFNFPSPPPAKNLICAVELLYALGALDSRGNLTSPLGEQMSEFPLPPTFSKMLLTSGEYGCAEEITTIAALLQVETVFQAPWGQNAMKARMTKRKFEVAEGDLLTLLNVYTAYMEAGKTKHFCSQNFLHYKRLRRAEEIKKQMLKMLHRFKVPIESCKGIIEPIIKCICAGFFPNAVYLHHSGYHRTVRGDLPVFVHPTSLLYTLPQPQWLLFTEIIHTTHIYMRDLTVVQPQWLEELAPHFYKKTTEVGH
ncbi:putative ATP-dependent RNA helicase DHX35 [Folsomia candida]|uniref:RNA helicase n=1 Tax=Folsomia candida TaxID=158441 RepID=A0A226E4Y1_FOLCA|nr:putative ATP-dependent RNA helicase DHX35 [Folsomia candida]